MSLQLDKRWLWLLGVLLIAVLLRLPALEMLIDNDGGARAYQARLILADEPLYGSHHTGHYLPAIYYTYATAMALFGDSAWAIQFFLLLWTIPTVCFLLWPYDLEATQNLNVLLGSQTRLVVIDHLREPSPSDWFMTELATNYLLAAEFDEQIVYRRVE